ncbi:MAG TPA: glycosyltransferase family 39 protein [Solirubrobacteraceae bacterium]|nr:glycosyltransferase family 39 protein [Solirubrobacteraceae bacterium]
MSAQEQSFWGVTRKPQPSTALPAPVGHATQRVGSAVGSARLQLAALLTLAGGLNLWALSRNGWANTYYSAAVRSMSSSWHDFLFGAMDRAGVMTVDKPPLALWVQAASVRVFGYHPLSVLVPQALMGVASVALVYDLVRRRFGRLGGFVAGLALALTPITVGISRHNNPDALLVLCCVAAVWCTVRALEGGRMRWLVGAGVCVGLGFETKMAVALMVVPGIVAAWLWVAPHGRRRALGELLGAGGAMVLVGGAWPALVELTPAADRPWVSGTSNNTVWQLITEYNGAGRLDGQTGGPGGMGGNMFGGTPGVGRLLNSALGGQAGWLLGFALVSGVAVLLASRLRRGDARSSWLIAVGGAFLVVALVFSEAKGIFHPYYVSLLAPFAAALTGAGVAQLRTGGLQARVLAPLAIVAGVACEVAVLHQYPGQLRWVVPVLIVVGAGAALVLGAFTDRAIRTAALSCGVAALLIAPGVWAVDTLGYATSGTFPSGGPQSALTADGGGPGGGFGPRVRGVGGPGGVPLFGSGPGAGAPGGAGEGPPLPPGGAAGPPAGSGGAGGGLPGAGGSSTGAPAGAGPGAASGLGGIGGGGGPVGAPLGNDRTITAAIAYAKAHGGGTVAVSSQSSAASAIASDDAEVAGIGGFSGRESDVSVAWLAGEVRRGQIRWVLAEGTGSSGPRLPGDTRAGSRKAMTAVTRACAKVTLTSGADGAEGQAAGGQGGASALYDCQGHAAALASGV